jgi:predicted MFS family arabinose efflux permease
MSKCLRPSHYAWLVVALLWLVALLNYLDRLIITTMREPIKVDIAMTDAQFGLLTSVFLWVYAGFSPLGGYLADRVGRRRVILGSLLLWSIATWLSGHAHTFEQLFLARGLMGVSEACYIPAALALIADYHRGSTRSLAMGLHMSGIYTGAALGGVGGYVAQFWGWRSGFTLFGAVGVAYALLLTISLWDAPLECPVAEEPGMVKTPRRSVLAALFGQPWFWVLLTLNVFVGVVNWLIYTWLPTYLQDQFTLKPGPAGLYATVYLQAASFAGALLGGAWADRWSRRNGGGRALVPALGYFAAVPFLFVAASTSGLSLAISGFVVFGLARGFYDANLMPILRNVVDPRHSATGYGFLNFISSAAGGVMVYGGGVLKDRQVDLGYVFQGCAVALAIVAFMLFMMRLARPAPTPSDADERGMIPDAAVDVLLKSELGGKSPS